MPTNSTSRYQQLLDAVIDDESFVRQTFGYMEADLRTLALATLADWAAADLSDAAEVLFEAVGSLQRPAWGAWNGLLLALARARRKIARQGDAASRKRLEQATTVQTILTGLERKLDPALNQKLQPLIALARHQGGLSLQQLLALPIRLRNRAAHDDWSDPALWTQAAAALRPLVGWLAEEGPIPSLPESGRHPIPFFIPRDDQWWAFNGIEGTGAIYTAPGGVSTVSPEGLAEVLLLFQRVLGKTAEQEESFRKWLGKLAPEDVKGVLLDDFLVGRPVGQGGFATVHKGMQLSTGRRVAVKILRDGLPEEARLRFQQEAAFLARCEHPHVVGVIGYGEAPWSAPRAYSLDGEPWYADFAKSSRIKTYIALEWVDGRTLDTVIRGEVEPAPDFSRKIEWFLGAAEALVNVHANGLIHRDVKPGNLMVTEAGAIKLMDFGIARTQADDRTIVTATGQTLGTPAYMAPEQIRAEDAALEVGPAADIYGLCATFYEVFTGARLFQHDRESAETVRTRKLAGQPPAAPRTLAPGLEWELETILLGGLQYEIPDRYRSAEALARDLRHVQNDEPIEYRRPSFPRRMRLAYRRNRAIANTAGVFCAVIALLTTWYLVTITHERDRAEANARAEQRAKLDAQKNLVTARLHAGKLEANAGRFQAAARQMADASQVEDSFRTGIALWDVLATLPGSEEVLDPQGAITTLTVLDGQRTAAASNRDIMILSLDGRMERWPQEVGMVFALGYLKGSDLLFASGDGGRLQGWRIADHAKVIDIEYEAGCRWLDVARESRRLAVGCRDGVVHVYDLDDANAAVRETASLKVAEDEVSVALSPDGSQLFTLAGGEVRVWDIRSGQVLWQQPAGGPGLLFRSPPPDLLGWVLMDGSVKVADPNLKKVLRVFQSQGATIGMGMAFSPNGQRVAVSVQFGETSNKSPSIVEWNLTSGSQTMVYEGVDQMNSLVYANNDYLIAGAQSGAIYRLRHSSLRQTVSHGSKWVRELHSLPDRSLIAVRCGVLLTDPNLKGLLGKEMSCKGDSTSFLEFLNEAGSTRRVASVGQVRTAAATPDNRLLVGTETGAVLELALPGGEIRGTLLNLDEPIQLLVAGPDGWVVLGSAVFGGHSGLYQLVDGRLVEKLIARTLSEPQHMGKSSFSSIAGLSYLTAAAFSRDGKKVVFAAGNWVTKGSEAELIEVDLTDLSRIRTLPVWGQPVRSILPLVTGPDWALALASGELSIIDGTNWHERYRQGMGSAPLRGLAQMGRNDQAPSGLLGVGDLYGRLSVWDLGARQLAYQTMPAGEPLGALIAGGPGQDWWAVVGGEIQRWRGVGDLPALRKQLETVRIDYFEELRQRAVELSSGGDRQAALTLLDRLTTLKPWDVDIMQDRVKLLDETGRYADELEAWDRMLKTAKARADLSEEMEQVFEAGVFLKKGMIYGAWWQRDRESGLLAQSVRYFLAYLGRNDGDIAVHGHLQHRLLEAGHFELARRSAALMFRLHRPLQEKRFSRRPLAQIAVLASFMSGAGLADARRMLAEAWPEDPDNGPEQNLLYELLSGKRVNETELRALLPNSARPGQLLFLAGMERRSAGDDAAARRFFQEGIDAGEYLLLNRQALAQLDGNWKPVEIPGDLIDACERLLDSLDKRHRP